MTNPDPALPSTAIAIDESIAGSIPMRQVEDSLKQPLKRLRRQAQRRCFRTLRALGLIPSGWSRAHIGLIISPLGSRMIVAVEQPTTHYEE